jgi:anti-anti-sigma factor
VTAAQGTGGERAGTGHAGEPDPSPYRVQLIRTYTHVLLCVSGELDLATAPCLLQDLQRALAVAAAGQPIVIDLGQVRFCDLVGLAALAAAARAGDTEHCVGFVAGVDGAGNLRQLLELLERVGRPNPLPLYPSLSACPIAAR